MISRSSETIEREKRRRRVLENRWDSWRFGRWLNSVERRDWRIGHESRRCPEQ
jgi:hypothetical protein